MRIALGEDEHIEIILVPLIDCLCFLLFFFLAASTLKKAEQPLPGKTLKSAQEEVNLPDINLSRLHGLKAGSGLSKKTVVSLKMNGKEPQFFVDDRQVSSAQLDTELKRIGEIGQVSLRRDSEMPCALEDQVILQCQKAGIDRVSIVVVKSD